jgi:hypothetical protein
MVVITSPFGRACISFPRLHEKSKITSFEGSCKEREAAIVISWMPVYWRL